MRAAHLLSVSQHGGGGGRLPGGMSAQEVSAQGGVCPGRGSSVCLEVSAQGRLPGGVCPGGVWPGGVSTQRGVCGRHPHPPPCEQNRKQV